MRDFYIFAMLTGMFCILATGILSAAAGYASINVLTTENGYYD